jgi:Spy/CpxP family protein refolding chaperone
MERMNNFPKISLQPLRRQLPRWLCTMACVAALGAPSLPVLAQTSTDARETEQPPSLAEPAAETEVATEADPKAASPTESEPQPVWNRRRVAPGGVDGQLRRLADDLRLDAGQRQKIRPILLAQRDQMQRLQRDSALAPAERQKRILALGDRSAEQIRAQLTDEQRAQYIKPRPKTAVSPLTSPARRGSAGASTPGTQAGKEVKP